MNKTIGLIDFGSNTFHLVIAAIYQESFDIIYRKRLYIFLAEGGISTILPEAMSRALAGAEEFYNSCQKYKVEQILSVGTASLRSADNSHIFLNALQSRYNIIPEIIDGEREADLIYKGVREACPLYYSSALIMDIGGGSTEFTLTHKDKIVFRESLNTGLGVLRSKFSLSDPVTETESDEVERFLIEESRDLARAVRRYPPDHLIGCSGTFDIVAEAITGLEFAANTCSKTTSDQLIAFIDPIIHSTLSNRLKNPSIPAERVKLVVYAFLALRQIWNLYPFQSVIFSKFALKEGRLLEYQEEWLRKKE